MTITPTNEQLAIIEAASTGQSVAMRAYAGAAKTTTALMAEKVTDKLSVLNVSFSTRNKKDFDLKSPQTENKTFNGLGYGPLINLIGKRPTLLSKYGGKEKTYNIMREMSLPVKDHPDLGTVVALLRNNAYIPEGAINEPGQTHEDTFILDLVDEAALDVGALTPEETVNVSKEIIRRSIRLTFSGVIDFDDQLYIPTIYPAMFKSYQQIFIDETQDLTAIQHMMLKKIIRPATQILAAGDPHQSIYGFRGALCDSYYRMISEFNLSELPLSTSFRCAKSIIEEAQAIVPGIRAWDQAPEGSVTHLQEWTPSIFMFGDMILCRNNKPLVSLFYQTLKLGLPAKILGSDIGKGLVKLTKTLAKNTNTMPEFLKALDSWAQTQLIKKPHKEGWISEQRSILKLIAEKESSTEGMVTRILSMFSDDIAPITFSTIHKVKGLEFSNVYILDKHLIPSRFARTEDQLTQESNLLYVAITRAARTLTYISTPR